MESNPVLPLLTVSGPMVSHRRILQLSGRTEASQRGFFMHHPLPSSQKLALRPPRSTPRLLSSRSSVRSSRSLTCVHPHPSPSQHASSFRVSAGEQRARRT